MKVCLSPHKVQGRVDAKWRKERRHACSSQDTCLSLIPHRKASGDSHVFLASCIIRIRGGSAGGISLPAIE
jgi:hypothetical protein